jgi:prepilin-type N-terminal cleavage/methylation domain-containing protein
MFKLDKSQQGETIVEVLIAIAIVSSVLAIAYSTMARNLSTMRDNQERTEAAKIAQGQIEALKQAWGTVDGQADIISERSSGAPFCVSTGEGHSTGSSTVTSDITTDTFPYQAPCSSGFYNMGIRYNSGVYIVTVRWDRINGGNRNEIAMAYRVE